MKPVQTAGKTRAEQFISAIGSNQLERARRGRKLADFFHNRLTVDKRAIVSGAMMPPLVVAIIGEISRFATRTFHRIVRPMRAARTCGGGCRRFRATPVLTCMPMVQAAAERHMH